MNTLEERICYEIAENPNDADLGAVIREYFRTSYPEQYKEGLMHKKIRQHESEQRRKGVSE